MEPSQVLALLVLFRQTGLASETSAGGAWGAARKPLGKQCTGPPEDPPALRGCCPPPLPLCLLVSISLFLSSKDCALPQTAAGLTCAVL